MATRIVDLDRGKLVTYPGITTSICLKRKKPCVWKNYKMPSSIANWRRKRCGSARIKARRTCNEGRVRALKAMRRERSQRREVMGTAKMQVEEASRSGKIVFEMEDVCYQVDGKQLVKDFSAQFYVATKLP